MKNNITLVVVIVMFGIILPFAKSVIAYDNETVHLRINEKAGRQSKINDSFKNKLGYDQGIETPFAGNEIWRWLREGGNQEDKPVTRVLQHFHDPVYSAPEWDKAGFSTFPSALVWAQQPNQLVFGGDHSWVTARNSFYNALTTGSEKEFAETFQSLGQVMHLISDMAVPAHVRVDSHFSYLPWTRDVYEYYTTEHEKIVETMTPYPVDQSIFARAKASAFAATPISALWDQDACNNSSDPGQVDCDPDALWVQDAGLAESTNANFLSRDTFDDYTYPASGTLLDAEVKWHNRTPVVAEDQKIDYPTYAERVLPGGSRYKLAAMNYFAMELDGGMLTGYDKILDDEVNKDYAKELIPRAIGYSTALLDYFFRGDIDLKPGTAGGYALVNNTSENMTGTFAVYYNDTSGTRSKLVEWANTTVPANSQTQVGSIAIPDGHANPAKYFLVFKGTMGREVGGVAGRVVSLRPFGLLVIEITGSLYNAKGEPQLTGVGPMTGRPPSGIPPDTSSNGAGSAMYLVWDVGRNAPLVIPKSGGGVWSYPLSAADYSGPWRDDLRVVFGETTEITKTEPLFNRIGGVQTEIISPPSIGGGLGGLYGGWRVYATQRLVDSLCGGYCGCLNRIDSDGEIYTSPGAHDHEDCCYNASPNEHHYHQQPISDINQTALNKYGVYDTWTEVGTDTTMEWDSRMTQYFPFDANSGQCSRVNNDAQSGVSYDLSVDLTFTLPKGGANGAVFIGYPSGLSGGYDHHYLRIMDVTSPLFNVSGTALPVPAKGEAEALICLNSSSAPVEVIGPRVEYAGTFKVSYSETITYAHGHGKIITSNTSIAAGTGIVTTISGVEIPISYDFTELAAISQISGHFPYKALDSYTGSRAANYCTDTINISSAIDTTDNFLALLAVQSADAGNAATELLPMQAPFTKDSLGSEGPVTYSDRSTSYHIRAICAAVDNADTQNPWELPDNTALAEELQVAIALYVAANPPGGNNHWNISTGIFKIQ